MITKYDIDQTVFFVHKDKIKSGIINRICIDRRYFMYSLEVSPDISWGLVVRKAEYLIFATKEELLLSLSNT